MDERRPEPKKDRKRASTRRDAPGDEAPAPRRSKGSKDQKPAAPEKRRRAAVADPDRPRRPRSGEDDAPRGTRGGANDRKSGAEDRLRRTQAAGAARSRPKREGAPAGRNRAEAPDAAPGFGPFARADEERRPRRADREFRSVAEEAVARGGTPANRNALRLVKRDAGPAEAGAKAPVKGPAKGTARKAKSNLARSTGSAPAAKAVGRVQDAVIAAAKALDRGYEREAVRMLKPHRDLHPDNPFVRELLGVGLYRLGRWAPAQKELEAFAELTGSAEQHPLLMDCARALGRHAKVAKLWEQLRAASPAAAIMVEGRIVAAGSLADRGQLAEAIALLERAQPSPKRVAEHHLRLWYALADLQERAGDLPAARTLFRRVSSHDPSFVDVAERLAALS